MSCDKYNDVWDAFFKLYRKYWSNNPYKTYICTESIECEHAETIKVQGSWTKRFREALEQIDSEYVIVLLEDFFLRNKVDQKRIEATIPLFDDDTACFDFQQEYFVKNLDCDKKGYKLKPTNCAYTCSCQPAIWDRKKLINLLQGDKNPWEWEMYGKSSYKHYINDGKLVFDIGFKFAPFAITQGKWCKDIPKFFEKEEIQIDYSKRGFYDIELSIIIPYYKTLELTKQLLNRLIPQMNINVEILLIDDGCFEKELDKYPIRVIHKNNGGVSSARNIGLNLAGGKYIAFVDSDDMVSGNYIDKIQEKTKEEWDYCYISWENSQGKQYVIEEEPPQFNKSVWNCVYKREAIDKNRFKENLQYGEDWEFNDRVRKGKRANITDILYIYNTENDNSLTKRFSRGEITAERPLQAQLVMYLRFVSKIGGVETFLYEFFKEFHNKHDILFLYDEADPIQIARYKKFVRCKLYRNEKIECETYLNVNCPKNIADNVTATSGNYYDMYHTDYDAMQWQCPLHPKTTMAICVSEVVKKAFTKYHPNTPCVVIPNLIKLDEEQEVKNPFTTKGLKLITASRLSWEKGYSRMKIKAKKMNEKKEDFEWLVFTNDLPDEDIPNFKFMKPVHNVTDFFKFADYYVTCTNTEADSYSTKQALYKGLPIITTNYPSIYEQGFVDGKTGYVLEMDMKNLEEVIDKMKNIPKVKPIKPNHAKKWESLLGEEKKSDYVYCENEPIEQIEDKWIVTYKWVKDDAGQRVEEGKEATITSSERIRVLLEHGMIRRKD
jgi:glycosyltransferase involved in cell wall biosynthesis/uncharacterized protein YlbG (UPF0298 family)